MMSPAFQILVANKHNAAAAPKAPWVLEGVWLVKAYVLLA
jgi:hypothetical protein